MKAEHYFLTSLSAIDRVVDRIRQIIPNGKMKIVISSSCTKSSKQRNLQFKWYTEVSKSGIGGIHEETKDSVHLKAKWKFALPTFFIDGLLSTAYR